ncbi:unnamed protein product [Cyprideis torosa]|uniref:Uncharacterized protein n=1 Tax=Cyprideis torosa TaxID=163714 RepID=A0A7R8WPZ2_9CRUS|nr:unnamed protein product [Cyprideis torosa]CAG0905484.1 unnamed protein product [Cyprideis torosa]
MPLQLLRYDKEPQELQQSDGITQAQFLFGISGNLERRSLLSESGSGRLAGKDSTRLCKGRIVIICHCAVPTINSSLIARDPEPTNPLSSELKMYTSDWYSWRNRNELYQLLEKGDIIQQKIERSGFMKVLPQMEHWAIVLAFVEGKPLIAHVVNDGSGSSSGVGSMASGGIASSAGLASNAPLVFSGGSALASAGSASLSPGLTLGSGAVLVLSELAMGGSGGLVLLSGGGMISSGSLSLASSSVASSSEGGGPVKWDALDAIWSQGQEYRKHNFKDREWTPSPFPEMLERVYSEHKKGTPYHLMKYNCEQFAHYCRYGKRYSGQVAAFSKDVRWWTFGLLFRECSDLQSMRKYNSVNMPEYEEVQLGEHETETVFEVEDSNEVESFLRNVQDNANST